MPYHVSLPTQLKKSGWKVKIRDRERVEPPHVTIIRGPDEWRVGLRDCTLLSPPGGTWDDIPNGVVEAIRRACPDLRSMWDQMYPENPVGGHDD